MIKLEKLNGEIIYLNYFQILSLKSIPETKVKLTTGDFFLVKESVEEVMEKVTAFLRSILAGREA
ncbi:flagellar FlbD family protein [Oribacterium sp. oral taxon 102]|uniref:flagellar FlbD family protein n=1 Tax=Oribacterium sp. oral taxon 102 TaxID=671214 RepID=UPI0015BBA7E9|nr:flagellar FlbD family protein [Oribacterium sp. oral taxon 102]NWO21808.1 flagellar FlbD family protein [Oribacterium sp. oral taxon 102]